MVNERRRAVADGVQEADQSAQPHVLPEQRLVQPPPEFFQDLGEVLRRRARDAQAAGEGAVEMGVGADGAGHDQTAGGAESLHAGILALQLGAGADGGDLVSLDEQRAGFDDLVALTEGGEGAVGDEQLRSVRFRGHGHSSCESSFTLLMACNNHSGLTGKRCTRTPTALVMALQMAGAVGMEGNSPIPLAP